MGRLPRGSCNEATNTRTFNGRTQLSPQPPVRRGIRFRRGAEDAGRYGYIERRREPREDAIPIGPEEGEGGGVLEELFLPRVARQTINATLLHGGQRHEAQLIVYRKSE